MPGDFKEVPDKEGIEKPEPHIGERESEVNSSPDLKAGVERVQEGLKKEDAEETIAKLKASIGPDDKEGYKKDLNIERAGSFEKLYELLAEKSKREENIVGSTGEIFDADLTKRKVDAIRESLAFMAPEDVFSLVRGNDELWVSTITTRGGLRDVVKKLILECYEFPSELQEEGAQTRRPWWKRLFGLD